MITSNRPVKEWSKLIGDVPSATAILDRFLHHVEVITITGKSYRLRNRSARASTTGCSMKPVSSTKTMLRPLFCAFFYPRPILLSPIGDGRFVSLAGPTFGFLTAPTHASQHMPDAGRIVPHAKTPIDQFDDARQRPQFGADGEVIGF